MNRDKPAPLNVLVAEIARLAAAGDIENARKITLRTLRQVMEATVATIDAAVGPGWVMQAAHQEAQDGTGGGNGLIPDEALVTGNSTTDGQAARGLVRVLCQLGEPVIGMKRAELLAGATTRIDADAKAVTVLTAGAPKGVHGTPAVHDEAVLVTQVLARRIQRRAKAKADGAEAWRKRLDLTPKQIQSVVAVELALLHAAGNAAAEQTWDGWKRDQPKSLSKLAAEVIAAVEQGRQLTPEQLVAVANKDARRVIAVIAGMTDPCRPVTETLERLRTLWQRAKTK